MADKKMTKAEMAAQMGITPEQLAAKEAENKARIAAANAPAVKPAETPPPKASTEEQSPMDRLRGTLTAAVNAAANAVAPIVDMARDLKDGLDRSNTNDSNNNRLTRERERKAGLEP